MEISQLIPHVEALIFAADRPLPAADILELLNNALAFLEDRATAEQVDAAIEAIQEKYNSEFYAFSVRESGGGFQFLTKKDYYQTVAQLNGEKFLKRLSTAALETLAIIAYKQPISKGEIEHIRGVSTDYSITKLLEKELIVISGRSEELPGKPLLYSTSKAFMDYFGLNSPADLPKLKEVFEEDFVAPTQLTLEAAEPTEAVAEDEDGFLVVSENGELTTETTTIVMDDALPEEPTEEHEADAAEVADTTEITMEEQEVEEGSDEAKKEGDEEEEDEDEDDDVESDEDENEDEDEEEENDEDEDGEDDEEDDDDEENDEDKEVDGDEDENKEKNDDDDKDGDDEEGEEENSTVEFKDDEYDEDDVEKQDDADAEIEDADDRLSDEEDEEDDEESKR